MVRWVIAQQPARAVDCGCGSGRFSVALRRAGFVGPIIAVDQDPLAVAMTTAHLAAAGLPAVDVRRADFMQLELQPVVGATAFIGNPPYLRHHDLSAATKANARRIAAELDVELSGLAGLHVLFLLAIAHMGRKGDLGCFVTSSEWLDVGYGGLARGLLSGPLGLRFLAALRPQAEPFADAMSTAVVFGWRQGCRDGAALRLVDSPAALAPLERGRRSSLASIRACARWTPLLAELPLRRVEGRVPLGTLVRVHRGVATGHNGFFVLPRGEGTELGLGSWLRPCLHRAALVQRAGGLVREAHCSHALLALPGDLPEHPAVTAAIHRGRAAGVPDRYLCAHRRHWWSLPLGRGPAPVVATYMARSPPSFALNPDGCALVNVLHGLYPRAPMSPAQLEALVRWLNSHAAQLQGHRSYHGGLKKWEPRELEAVLVPPLNALLLHC